MGAKLKFLSLLVAGIVAGAATAAAAPLNPGAFFYKMDVVFSGYAGTTTLTDFPALVKLSETIPGFQYSQFASGAGADLRFADAAGNELNYEIEDWDTSGDSCVWVQVPSLSGAATTITAYWGNPDATTPPAYTTDGSTWDSNYGAVWHLAETVAGDGGTINDSTANNNDGTTYNGVTTDATGQIDGADAFDGTNDYISTGTLAAGSFGDGKGTVEAWIAPDRRSYEYVLDHSRTTGGEDRVGVTWELTSGELGAFLRDDGDYAYTWNGFHFDTSSWTLGDWHHVVFSWDKDADHPDHPGDNMFLYADGEYMHSVAGNTAYFPDAAGVASIADYYRHNNAAYRIDGSIDEMRLSNVARSDDWIAASWKTQAQAPADPFAQFGHVILIPEPAAGMIAAVLLGLFGLLLSRRRRPA